MEDGREDVLEGGKELLPFPPMQPHSFGGSGGLGWCWWGAGARGFLQAGFRRGGSLAAGAWLLPWHTRTWLNVTYFHRDDFFRFIFSAEIWGLECSKHGWGGGLTGGGCDEEDVLPSQHVPEGASTLGKGAQRAL